jgi:hypothetical protein
MATQLPLWVISRHHGPSLRRLLYPPGADIDRRLPHVGLVPKAGIMTSVANHKIRRFGAMLLKRHNIKKPQHVVDFGLLVA